MASEVPKKMIKIHLRAVLWVKKTNIVAPQTEFGLASQVVQRSVSLCIGRCLFYGFV